MSGYPTGGGGGGGLSPQYAAGAGAAAGMSPAGQYAYSPGAQYEAGSPGAAAQYSTVHNLAPRQDDIDPLLLAKRQATVVISEQPASKALRFRYECEGRSAGSIPGTSSTPEAKTFPSIRLLGYRGAAVVVVSCVTRDPPHRPHPHNLVGKDGCRKGVCTLNLNVDTMSVTFQNLGIQCVKKKDIEDSLRQREAVRVDPFQTGFDHRLQPSSIDLNSVRLCFQVFVEGNERGKFVVPLQPVVSQPIYDKKSMCDLIIYKMSDCAAAVDGGRDIILLCDKIAKDDVEVRFFEMRGDRLHWEGYGEFLPSDVHKQVAICFRTPKYFTADVNGPVRVQIELRRPSDGLTSEPRSFTLTPVDNDGIESKRRKMARNSQRLQNFLTENLGSVPAGGGFGVRGAAAGTGVRTKSSEGSAYLQQHIKLEPAETPPDVAPMEYTVPAAGHALVSPVAMSGGGLVRPPPMSAAAGYPPLTAAGAALYPAPADNIELDLSRLNSSDLNLLSFPSESDINAHAIQSHIASGVSQNLSFLEPPAAEVAPPLPHTGDQMDSFTRNAISELEFLNQLGKS